MSVAAEKAADYAFRQLIVSAIGLTLVVASLIFAGIAAFAARDAAVAATAQAKLTEITAQHQLRAYVFVRQVRMTNLAAGDRPVVRLRIGNSGQTPAYNLTATLAIGYGSYPVPPGAKFPDIPDAAINSRINIGPGGEVRHGVTDKRALTHDQFAMFQAGAAAIYVVGSITYLDAFKKDQTTTFRLVYNSACHARGDGRLDVCEEGNEAT